MRRKITVYVGLFLLPTLVSTTALAGDRAGWLAARRAAASAPAAGAPASVNTGAKHKMASRWRPMAKRLAKGLGVLLIGGAVATAGLHQVPNLMFNESQSRYGFDRTVAELTTAANQAGWKIPSVHDLQKPAKTPRPIKVLELCQQDHAHNILERAEKTDTTKLSAMMPCRISVYQKPDGQVYVSRLNGSLLSRFMPKEVGSVMRTAALENEAILSNVVK